MVIQSQLCSSRNSYITLYCYQNQDSMINGAHSCLKIALKEGRPSHPTPLKITPLCVFPQDLFPWTATHCVMPARSSKCSLVMIWFNLRFFFEENQVLPKEGGSLNNFLQKGGHKLESGSGEGDFLACASKYFSALCEKWAPSHIGRASIQFFLKKKRGKKVLTRAPEG